MKIGVIFPQVEIGPDPGAIRSYVEAVAELGYTHVLTYEHVVGADTTVHKGWNGPYDLSCSFHEPFVLFGYLAAISSLELVTGILILPQRQSVLVAKQAAEVDLLTGGRFRLGVGLGWNRVEYEALGKDFSNRGRRIAEQVTLMRRLWTEESVSFVGEFETVTGAGIAPLPNQRPIPVWFGAQVTSSVALRRVGRLADGWFPLVDPGPELEDARRIVEGAAREAGRDPATIEMEGQVAFGDGDVERLGAEFETWRNSGASHLCVNTMDAGLRTADDHVAALSRLVPLLDRP